MIKYKYRISGEPEQEIWVCESCKKGKTELILAGKWKLIDRCCKDCHMCLLCEENKGDEFCASDT